ncbi:ATP-binding protein [Sporosarcina sp. Te-1]|uniref:hybrid sensor histidine kinase/response regulator n=1 Tax=Sporosarcina sp. Te-1 TaxID=2818390 RepID=UPI001A9F8242|nr:ATP-binding protein [Sporosarcina sp. Te-1]QTD40850.1 response regulator [Sporosarcina sp. Te-1]
MKKWRIVLLTGFFLLLLTSFRMIWLTHYDPRDFPQAHDGVLDLRGFDLKDQSIQLNGEWTFYPWALKEPGELGEQSAFLNIPGKWRENLEYLSDEENPSFLYGTYHLRILLDENERSEPYSLYVRDIRSASVAFVNGKKVAEQGRVAVTANAYDRAIKPYTITIDPDVDEIDMVIQVADKGHSKISGMKEPILFGHASAINRSKTISMAAQILSVSILILHFLFALIVYFGFSRRNELLYLAVVFSSAALSILLDDDRLLLVVFPDVSSHIWMNLFSISYVTTVVFLMLFFKRLLFEVLEIKRTLLSIYTLIIALYAFYIVLLILDIRSITGHLFSILMICVPILIAFSLFRIVWRGMPGVIYLLFGVICIANNIAWASLKSNSILVLPYYPFDIIIAVLCFAVFWFKQFFHVTEESQALAERLQRINEQKDEFLANTSHELRNPLHGIMSISQTIYETEGQLSDENKKNMETLITVSRRMSTILNDLLDAQRLKEGRISLHKTDVDLAAVAMGAVDMLRFMSKGKNVQFKVGIADTFPYVLADENRMFQILFNLIHNAVKFTERGEIAITAKMEGKKAVIRVSDTGIGMTEQTMKSIFQPYEQADSSMTAMGSGLGLGLVICEQLVKLHGGELTVHSRLNEGSVFTFTVPLGKARSSPITSYTSAQQVPSVHLEMAAGTDNHKQPRVLVVDDDPLNVSIIEQILKANHFDVVTCTSGKEALERLNKGKWDLVLSDVMMPKMSGYELAERIRERFTVAELPILLLTARSQLEDIQAGFHFGANDYITKPVEKAELVTRVKALTDLRQSLSERIALEAAWLQAQIQPHFLFNTLNTIAALSDENPRKMMKLIDEFGNYLNASFTTQNLSELVPLEKELELVRSYVYIEQQRFGDRLHVEWDIRVQSNVSVPPLAIQTIVENAINHGVLRQPEGGTVRITITEQDRVVDISITDDGRGMEAEKVQRLLQKAGEHQRGIGLLNTDKRLKQLFGSGLTIQSELFVGTTVSFSIPL